MDRIAALRNVEEALLRFENGEVDLQELERLIGTVLRTYATDLDGARALYRVEEPTPIVDVVVVATSVTEAEDRVRAIYDERPEKIVRVENDGVDPTP